MRDRILIGQHGGSLKARISRPGVDVHDATDEQLLMTEDTKHLQILDTGIALFPTDTPSNQAQGIVTATFPDRGFIPFVWAWPANTNTSVFQYFQATDTAPPPSSLHTRSLSIQGITRTSVTFWIPYWANACRYIITSLRAD